MLVACVFSTSTLAFVYAILHTSVAHALVIITTSSIFAAIFSRLILKEKTAIVTWVTIIIVLVAMIFIVQEKTGNATITGNLAALTSAMCIALSFVLNRKFHHIDMLPALSISGLILATASVIFATQLAVDAYNLLLLLLVSALVTIAYASFAISPKYITAAEVSLFMPLETIIGILLVWAVLDEAPSYLALIAGSIILITLLAHSVYQLRSAKIRTMQR
ncbi:DMT family transporter [Ostreibacterium oceani]|uniref:EamA family transporter n=1 Tax=Ostreibacterium oceani TaxID=2654998 RepID=A0A6N7F1C1_9GAMM|nr:DMT family transporter [Ostreibacterium oceani]MPV86588.1 EamA family transporter [Ostreibacterium oceani]